MISHFSCVWFFVTLWTVACQVPLSMSFSKQGYWSGLPFPSPGNLPDSGIELVSYNSCIAGRSLTLGHQGKPEWLIWVAISYYTDVTNCINFPRFYNNTVYSVTVLMARSPNKVSAGCLPPRVLRNMFHASLIASGASASPCHPLACKWITSISASIFTWISFCASLLLLFCFW